MSAPKPASEIMEDLRELERQARLRGWPIELQDATEWIARAEGVERILRDLFLAVHLGRDPRHAVLAAWKDYAPLEDAEDRRPGEKMNLAFDARLPCIPIDIDDGLRSEPFDEHENGR